MKIVHVTGYFPPHIGGMEYRTKELAENQAKSGNSVTVLTSDQGCAVGKIPSTKNLTIHYLKSWEFAHTPLMPGLFFQLLTIPKDAVVHLHISQAFLAELTYIVCKLRKIPYIVQIHLDVSASGAFGILLPLYKKLFLSHVIREADGVSVLTEDYKTLMAEIYKIPKSKITIIPNGTYFTQGGTTRTGELHTPVRLLFVGRLSVQKNLPLAIRALHECIYTYKLPVHLSIAGDGEKREECEALVKELKLEKYVTFLGGVPLKEVKKVYTSSDIFILTSIQESFGSVLIEAMASGIPVISTNILAVKNVVKDGYNGLLVDQDPKDLAKAIKRVIEDNKLRKNLVKNGLSEVKKYTWETVTEQYRNLYKSISQTK